MLPFSVIDVIMLYLSDVVEAYQQAWFGIKGDCPVYYR